MPVGKRIRTFHIVLTREDIILVTPMLIGCLSVRDTSVGMAYLKNVMTHSNMPMSATSKQQLQTGQLAKTSVQIQKWMRTADITKLVFREIGE